MKKITFNFQLIIVFLFAVFQLQAQTENLPESILKKEQELASGNLDVEQTLKNYGGLMDEYQTRDMEKTRYYLREAVAYARKNKPDAEPRFFALMANIYADFNERDSAGIYFDKAMKLVESINDEWEKTAIYDLAGSYYSGFLNDMEKGIDAYLKALDINEKLTTRLIAEKKDIADNLRFNVRIRMNIALTYRMMLNVEKALEGLLEAKNIINENRNIEFYNEYLLDGNIGNHYFLFDEYEKAFPYVKNFYETAVAKGNLIHTANALISLSTYYLNTDNLKQALIHAKEALEIAEKLQMPVYINRAISMVTNAYIEMKDYKSALYYAELGLEKTEDNNYHGLQHMYSLLIIIYAGMNDIENVKKYIIESDQIYYKITDENMHNAVQEMQVKYDVQQKELEIVTQQAKIKQQRTRQFIYIGGLIAAGLMLTMLFLIVRQRNRRNRELAETNATKDKFFSIISHDLKNPAFSQRNDIRNLFENCHKWDADTISDYCRNLLKSANDNAELLQTLLSWAQTQTGRMTYQPILYDLVASLKSGISIIQNMANEKEVVLDLQMPTPALITGDEKMLETVVRNLLVNAIKYTEKGGTVTLRVEPTAAGKHTVTVSDTGTGMTPEQKQSLFRLADQPSQRGTAGEAGVGLGLIICKEFLKKHESELHVESEEGKGSRFWFEVM